MPTNLKYDQNEWEDVTNQYMPSDDSEWEDVTDNYFQEESELTSPTDERGFFGDIASHLGRGVMHLGSLTGHALQTIDPEGGIDIVRDTGQGLIDLEEASKKWKPLMPDASERAGEGFVKRGIMNALESTPASITPALGGAAAGGAIGSLFGPGPGTAIGALIGGTLASLGLFGLGTYGEKHAEYIEKGISEEDAHKGALQQAMVEGGIESVATLLGLKIFGVDRLVMQPLKHSVKELLKMPAKQLAKKYGQDMFVETATEMIQGGLGEGIDTKLGLRPEGAWKEGVVESIVPAMTMSLLFGMGTQVYNNTQRRRLEANLNSLNPDIRTNAIKEISNGIEDDELRDSWNNMASAKIKADEPIDLMEDFVKFGSLGDEGIKKIKDTSIAKDEWEDVTDQQDKIFEKPKSEEDLYWEQQEKEIKDQIARRERFEEKQKSPEYKFSEQNQQELERLWERYELEEDHRARKYYPDSVALAGQERQRQIDRMWWPAEQELDEKHNRRIQELKELRKRAKTPEEKSAVDKLIDNFYQRIQDSEKRTGEVPILEGGEGVDPRLIQTPTEQESPDFIERATERLGGKVTPNVIFDPETYQREFRDEQEKRLRTPEDVEKFEQRRDSTGKVITDSQIPILEPGKTVDPRLIESPVDQEGIILTGRQQGTEEVYDPLKRATDQVGGKVFPRPQDISTESITGKPAPILDPKNQWVVIEDSESDNWSIPKDFKTKKEAEEYLQAVKSKKRTAGQYGVEEPLTKHLIAKKDQLDSLGFDLKRKSRAFTNEPQFEVRENQIPIFKSTNEAIEFGKTATPEQIKSLKTKLIETYKEQEKINPEENLQEALDKGVESQFYREALEAAGLEVNQDARTVDDLINLEIRQDQTPGQGLDVKDIQKIFPGQSVSIEDNGQISVRLKNGKGIIFENIKDAGNDFIDLAVQTGQMSEKGKILGVTIGNKISLDSEFADNKTLWHENKHVLDNLGITTKEDDSALNKEFNKLRKTGKLQFALSTVIDPKTGKPDYKQRAVENRANTFAQIMTSREEYRDTPLGKMIQKVMDFFNQLYVMGRRVVTANKAFQTASSLARETESGKIYGRKAGKEINSTIPQVKAISENIISEKKQRLYNMLESTAKDAGKKVHPAIQRTLDAVEKYYPHILDEIKSITYAKMPDRYGETMGRSIRINKLNDWTLAHEIGEVLFPKPALGRGKTLESKENEDIADAVAWLISDKAGIKPPKKPAQKYIDKAEGLLESGKAQFEVRELSPGQKVDSAINLLREMKGLPKKPIQRVPKFSGLIKESRVAPQESEPLLEEIETEFTLDKTNLLPTLLKDISNQAPAKTMIYELMQNSLDALPTGEGNINIDYNSDSTLTFTDDGKGMSPEEVKKFFLVGGSIGKSGQETRGGYGLAKIALLLIPESIKLTTISNGILSTINATREQIYNGKIKIIPEKTNKPNGTTFEAKLPNELYGSLIGIYEINSAYKKVIDGTFTKAKITYGITQGNQKKVHTNNPGLLESVPKKIESDYFSMNDSDIAIHYIKTDPYGYKNYGGKFTTEGMITNKGLIVDIPINRIIPDVVERPDCKVIIDFTKTPNIRDPKYPFLKNRTELERDVLKKIEKIIKPKIRALNMDSVIAAGAEFGKMVDASPEYNGIKVLIPYSGTEFEIAKEILDDNIPLINDISMVVSEFKEILINIGEEGVDFHITIDPSVYGFKSNKDLTGYDLYAINPFALSKRIIESSAFLEVVNNGRNPSTVKADTMTHTLVHEYTHKKEFNHSENFAIALANLTTKIGHKKLFHLSNLLEGFYEKHSERIESITDDLDILRESRSELQNSAQDLSVGKSSFGGERSVRGLEGAFGNKVNFEVREPLPEQKISDKQYDQMIQEKESLLKKIKQSGRMKLSDIKLMLEKSLTPISTRLKNIGLEELSGKLRKLDFRTAMKITRALREAHPMMKKAKKDMSSDDKIAWDWARKNSDLGKIIRLARKYGIEDNYLALRETLNQIRLDAIDVGLEVGFIEDYWPRVLKDQEGFLQATQEISRRSVFTEAIKKKAKELGITVDELEQRYPDLKADIISNIILGRPIGIGGPSNTQSRVFDTIPDEFAKFYMDSDAALMQYIYSMTKKIEARRFFGKVPQRISELKRRRSLAQTELIKLEKLEALESSEVSNEDQQKLIDAHRKRIELLKENITDYDIELTKYKNQRDYTENIGAYIADLKNVGKLKPKDEHIVKDVLSARFHEKGTTGPAHMYKNIAYIDVMGNPMAAITQIGDSAWAMYVGEIWNPKRLPGNIRNLIRAIFKKSKITKEDLGIERMAQEFADFDSLSNLVSKVFKGVGLEKIDSIGKEFLINNAFDTYKRQASTEDGRKKLLQKIKPIFENKSNEVINDLLANNPSENVKMLLYSRLLDFQPVALSEMPEYYLNGGNWRILYMLKTYTIKQIDVFRNEVWQGLKDGNAIEKLNAMKRMTQLMGVLALANAGADEIKDFMMGKETKLSDEVIENFLTMGGANRFVRMQARREGLGTAVGQLILPPFKFVNSLSKDVFSGDIIDPGESRIIESLPFVGKLAYWNVGRGSNYRPNIEEQDFNKLGKKFRQFKKDFEESDDKRIFLHSNVDEFRQMKVYENFSKSIGKINTLINKLEKLKQTTSIRKRIGQLTERQNQLRQKYFILING